MKTISALPPPAHVLAFLLWFITLVFGTVLLSCHLLLFGQQEPSDALAIGLICSGFAAAFSLPTLPILPVGLRWAFTAALVPYRWLRLLVVVSILFGVATFYGYRFLLDANGYSTNRGLLWYGAPYLPAALLAAACVYYPWLFRFDAPAN